MATISVSNVGNTGLYWRVTGLSNPFNTTYYDEAGICSANFTDGTSSRPSVIDSVYAPSSGSSTSTPSTFADGAWTPGKTYTSYGFTRAVNLKYYKASSVTYTMNISAPNGLSVDNTYTNALYITWNPPDGGDGVEDYDLRYRTSGGSYSYIYGISGSRDYYTVPNLNAGTTYYISLMANGLNKSSSWSSETSGTTDAPQLSTPTFNSGATIKTATTITVTVNAVAGATTYYCYLYNSSGSTLIQSPAGQSSRNFTFSGLSVNTTYGLKAKCAGSGYLDSDWSGLSLATTGLYNWNWTTAKTSGATFNVSATEWKSFMTKINEVRNAKGLANWGFGTGEVYSGGDFKYYLFTQCANAIYDIQSNVGGVNSACRTVTTGSIIYASYFENLKQALNNVIATL